MQKTVAKADQWTARSMQLMKCIVDLPTNGKVKMQLTEKLATELMPGGRPNIKHILMHRPIIQLVHSETDGIKNMLKVLTALLIDFNSSLNLVRPMNEQQVIEAAGYLLDECYDYRIEDYVVMLNLAKRGKLVKIMDRMDIQVIGNISCTYWAHRQIEAERIDLEEHKRRKRDELFIPKPVTDEEIEASERFKEMIEKMKELPGHTEVGLGTRIKEELDSKITQVQLEVVRQQIQQRQREKLEQSSQYCVGLKISWYGNFLGYKNGKPKPYGQRCTGKIVAMKGDSMEVKGVGLDGSPAEDYLSIKDLSIEIIKTL